MQRTVSRSGSAMVTVIALLALVVIGFGAWFMMSKPFQTHVKDSYRGATEWTAENIKADPVGYLSWATDEVGKTAQKLEASQLALKTKFNAVEREMQRHAAENTQYEKLLEEFKQAYTSASGKFPTTVREISFDENALKRKIVECNDKLTNEKSLMESYAKSKSKIDTKLTEIDSKLSEVVKLKEKLSTDLEIAKVNKSVEGIDSIGDQLNAIVDTSKALVSTAEQSVSVEEMIKPTSDSHVNDEFSKIMGNK